MAEAGDGPAGAAVLVGDRPRLRLRVVGAAHAIDERRTPFHGADEDAADGEEPGAHPRLQGLRRAAVDHAGRDGARREPVLHQGHQHRIEDPRLGACRAPAGDGEVGHLGEGHLADEIVDEIRTAHGDGVGAVGAEMSGGLARRHGDPGGPLGTPPAPLCGGMGARRSSATSRRTASRAP